MTLQWIPLDALMPHPENSNRLPPHLMKKLKAHIARTGLYEPLVVRPMPSPASPLTTPVPDSRFPVPAVDVPGAPCPVPGAAVAVTPYQLLNGHHRARVLRELGHTHARCDVWLVNDADARLLLATLNRLEGRDDPAARGELVARLMQDLSPDDLVRLLPEPAEAIERLKRLASPPPTPADPATLPPRERPMTFFLTEAQHALVTEALGEAGLNGPTATAGTGNREPGTGAVNSQPHNDVTVAGDTDSAAPCRSDPKSEIQNPKCRRSDALERLAQWYLEACGRR